ncbi:unnamed protein product [Rotaria sordida]|uniref:Uncharacterized protein n=1 Tax=Rotaria sordida TaxID=392033 RepID=A0A815MNG6_9BILA|nr:unnamed protein product [Rotaria sordida]CAF1418670.1 unnamed protein product [Rotaria sordida]CAF1420569.1 unnamed protein product [Rotaria sordida]CAF1601637.1 unnamed protein product [Rotaria sordida]CAF3861413.1 unnamed protein product [Rotaria sordida]
MNDEEKHYREQLTTYALYDCFSMQKIIIDMKNKNFKFSFEMTKKISYDLVESISSSDDEIMFSQLTPSIERLKNDQTLNINKQEQLASTSPCGNFNWTMTSTDDNQLTNQ